MGLVKHPAFRQTVLMPKTLFLLDGMALVYRAHFAFIRRPIFTSQGVNTSALFGFTSTLLDILDTYQPTHLAVAFDTEAPTQRHVDFPEYKAHREAMPEDISFCLPHVERLLEAFRIELLTCDGYEADDIIGTLAHRAEPQGFECYMVTPDKDFAQLITERTWILKPGRSGDPAELIKPADLFKSWGVKQPEQVIDILALAGDSSDNIPGVPGIGGKTAAKLMAEYGTLENLLAHTADLKGKQKERIETHRDQALLSKKLATILLNVPIQVDLEELKLKDRDEAALKKFFMEFEFNTLGRRLFGEDFKAGRGFTKAGQGELGLAVPVPAASAAPDLGAGPHPGLKTIRDVAHEYCSIVSSADRAKLITELSRQSSFCFDTETTGLNPREAQLLGLSFSYAPHRGCYVPLPAEPAQMAEVLREFAGVLQNPAIEKVGHNLKFDLSVLRWQGLTVQGPFFDTMLAHSLIEPDQRHGMDFLAEAYLGYSPIPIRQLIGDKKSEQRSMADVPLEILVEYAAEDADVTWQLRACLEPLLREKGQEKVFYEIESPLLPVLVDMEYEGVRVDAEALAQFGLHLSRQIAGYEKKVHQLGGREFNLNSPKQLGEVLFDELKLARKPKRTRTGQYATDEQTLLGLAAQHEIVRLLLEFRTATKLKSTYADTLPEAISPRTGRVHTTYNQAVTATGRLQSQDPNLQNIPIRTELGQEIRKTFVPRAQKYRLLSADYSQIELRIIAALSSDPSMLEAFDQGHDIHSATAARIYDLPLEEATPEMRRQAKMVNFGIIYGISAFGLAQRLGISREESAAIIEQYFRQYPRIQKYISDTIAFAKEKGYVATVSGRRRYLRDINSANATIRAAAERTAINTPIQGTAADMIKLAMAQIHQELIRRQLKTRMLMQVHDELVFDLFTPEESDVRALVEEKMKTAIALPVPIVVEIGTGRNWLEAH
jgi:DNA polymerase-1